MKNIPVFDTENGVGSLIIKEIPYTKVAYIKVEAASDHDAFLDECVSFCRMVGAEKIFVTGYCGKREYPFHTAIQRMECSKDMISDTDAQLVRVTQDTLQKWLHIYWNKMCKVPNAAYMTEADGKEMIKRGDGYFVFAGNILLGIGIAAGSVIDLVASLQPGAGRIIVCALCRILDGKFIQLDVASTNQKAISLYESIGFLKKAERSQWYKII